MSEGEKDGVDETGKASSCWLKTLDSVKNQRSRRGVRDGGSIDRHDHLRWAKVRAHYLQIKKSVNIASGKLINSAHLRRFANAGVLIGRPKADALIGETGQTENVGD